MKRQYIAELDGKPVREGHITVREPEAYSHAVVGVHADSGRAYVLGWYDNEFIAHAEAAKNWRGRAGYCKVVVVPVKGYPVKELVK